MNAPLLRQGNAKKEIGFGHPPAFFNPDSAVALAKVLSSPASRGIVVESAQWNIVVPIADSSILQTFSSKVIAPFNTPNGQPPSGVATSSNTLQAAQMPSSDMVVLGVRTRFLVEPESRLIRGNTFIPAGGMTSAPGSPDVYSENDFNNNVFGFPGGESGITPASQDFLAAELLWGTPTWRIAFNLLKAFDLDWRMNNQDSLVREPLTEVGSVEPFAEAMAAGTSFTSNIDRISVFNARLAALGIPNVFEPITHKRLGSFNGGGQTNTGDFTVTREEDGSPTVYGGIGVPEDEAMGTPYIFPVPIYWPSGQPFGLQLSLNDAGALSLAEAQRWLSVTGGINGQAGADLNFPPGPGILTGFTATGAGFMDEITLDPVGGAGQPTAVSQGAILNRFLGKGGTIVIQQGILGLRIPQDWKASVYQAIKAGAIQAPMGFGTLQAAASAQ